MYTDVDKELKSKLVKLILHLMGCPDIQKQGHTSVSKTFDVASTLVGAPQTIKLQVNKNITLFSLIVHGMKTVKRSLWMLNLTYALTFNLSSILWSRQPLQVV